MNARRDCVQRCPRPKRETSTPVDRKARYNRGMSDTPHPDITSTQRAWASVEDRIARERASRFRATGVAASPEALWALECELRASPGYPRARALDVEHHIRWRALLDQVHRASAR